MKIKTLLTGTAKRLMALNTDCSATKDHRSFSPAVGFFDNIFTRQLICCVKALKREAVLCATTLLFFT